MELQLYLLEMLDRDILRPGDVATQVIAAETEQEARELATGFVDDETPHRWLEKSWATCHRIGTASSKIERPTTVTVGGKLR